MQQHQQQQQEMDFDLLAVFKEESSADAAEAKLHKEGYGPDEVFRLASGSVGRGEFREHGPGQERREIFLQTKRTGPSPRLVVLFAVLFSIVLGALSFGVVELSLKSVSSWLATLIGVLVGLVLGSVVGLTRKGQVRGNIGQERIQSSPAATPSTPTPVKRPPSTPSVSVGALTVIALRLPDAENISRKSKARAILLNNGGKIDRSVGRE